MNKDINVEQVAAAASAMSAKDLMTRLLESLSDSSVNSKAVQAALFAELDLRNAPGGKA